MWRRAGYNPATFHAELLLHAKIGDTIPLRISGSGSSDFAFRDARDNGPGMVETRVKVVARGTITGSDVCATELNWDPVRQVVDYSFAVFGHDLERRGQRRPLLGQ